MRIMDYIRNVAEKIDKIKRARRNDSFFKSSEKLSRARFKKRFRGVVNEKIKYN